MFEAHSRREEPPRRKRPHRRAPRRRRRPRVRSHRRFRRLWASWWGGEGRVARLERGRRRRARAHGGRGHRGRRPEGQARSRALGETPRPRGRLAGPSASTASRCAGRGCVAQTMSASRHSALGSAQPHRIRGSTQRNPGRPTPESGSTFSGVDHGEPGPAHSPR